MGIWTHVNGSIRINGHEYNSLPVIDEDKIPRGSNGPLEYHYQIVNNGFNLANLTIWGDLSNYDNIDEIVEWIKDITKGSLIRSGVFEISVEYERDILMYFDHNECNWIIIELDKNKGVNNETTTRNNKI